MQRVLCAHAAVTEGARRLVEEMAIGRIVHVDVMLVGESKLHDAQHIALPRPLNELEAPYIDARPVDGIRIDFAPVICNAKAAKALQNLTASSPAAIAVEEIPAAAPALLQLGRD